MVNYDVFISYRRDTGAAEARLLRESLMARGVTVFLDVVDLRKGYFDEELLRRISAAPNFIPVLTPGALDRSVEAQDWMRQEIAHAIRERRNIIPVMVGEFAFPSALPDDLVNLPRHQGIQYSHQYFDAMTQSIVESLELGTGPRAQTVDRGRDANGVRGGQPRHWSYRALVGASLGLVGGAINAALLAQSVSIDLTGVLLVCGVIPGAIAALTVRRAQGLVPRATTAAVAGAVAVDLLFLLNFLMLGGSVSEFNRHLPFWLGPGDDHIMMGEAFMGGLALGVVPAILASLGEAWLSAIRRR
jgi:hypothetical protein